MLHGKRRAGIVSLWLTVAVAAWVALATVPGTRTGHAASAGTPIEIAICLDTSGSMDGLIESAKQKVWTLVNDLATAEPTPELRVALLSYGNDGHQAENGWVSIDVGLTTDLDAISARLFELTTNGGEEYVARALRKAKGLEWSRDRGALQLVIVAGNEAADQDPAENYTDIVAELRDRGILVNAIYCGAATDHLAPDWRTLASAAEGEFASIDPDHGTVVVATPFDEELTELGTALNATYIPMGTAGADGAANQVAQDANAASLNKSAEADRACTKASKLYSCSWDLVDAYNAGEIDFETIETAQLPLSMRSSSLEQKVAFVVDAKTKRNELREKIESLGRNRDRFIREEIERSSLDESSSFDLALRAAIRRQAEAKGFAFSSAASDQAARDESESKAIAATATIPARATVQRVEAPFRAVPAAVPVAIQRVPSIRTARIAVLDRVRHDAEITVLEVILDRASWSGPGSGNQARLLVDGTTVRPDRLVSVGSMEDWTALLELLGAGPELAQSKMVPEILIDIDGYIVLVDGGC